MATERLNLRKKYSKIVSEAKGDEAETAKMSIILAFTKNCFLLLLLMYFSCYGNIKFSLTYNGKSENWHLLPFHCRYFDKSYSEMFIEWSSTKHIIWDLTSQFDWLSWQLKGCEKYSKVDSEAILWVKLKLCRNVHSISLYDLDRGSYTRGHSI